MIHRYCLAFGGEGTDTRVSVFDPGSFPPHAPGANFKNRELTARGKAVCVRVCALQGHLVLGTSRPWVVVGFPNAECSAIDCYMLHVFTRRTQFFGANHMLEGTVGPFPPAMTVQYCLWWYERRLQTKWVRVL